MTEAGGPGDAVFIILNPAAGTRKPGLAASLADLCREEGVTAKVVAPDAGHRIPEMARLALREGFRKVAAAGGDGTVNSVASVLANSGAALGVLPLGTLNHFAKDNGIPLDLPGAVRVLHEGRPRAVDIAECNGRYFVNNSSLGLYPNIVVRREQLQRKLHSKWLSFAVASWNVFRRYPFLRVRLQAEAGAGGYRFDRKTPFVLVANNEYALQGLEFGSRNSLNGGKLHVYVAAPVTRPQLFSMAIRAVLGRLDPRQGLQALVVDDIWIDARRKRVRVSADGEVFRERPPLHYRIHPGGLLVIAP